MTFNVGPYRTAHAHHDALAVTYYSAAGRVLVDSGCHLRPTGRGRLFKSTRRTTR